MVKWQDRRTHAAKIHALDRLILKTLGQLTSEGVDLQTARKMDLNNSGQPLTPKQIVWIDAAIRLLIRRLGEYAADPTAPWPTLSMRDLPLL